MIREIPDFSRRGVAAAQNAIAVLGHALLPLLTFPHRVFKEGWANFYFFDPSRIFEVKFATMLLELLKREDACCASLLNLNAFAGNSDAAPIYLLSPGMDPEGYRSYLIGEPSSFKGWVYGQDRFFCASDSGVWALYADREAELAVVAFRRAVVSPVMPFLTNFLAALPPMEAAAKEHLYVLRSGVAKSGWVASLLKEYGCTSR